MGAWLVPRKGGQRGFKKGGGVRGLDEGGKRGSASLASFHTNSPLAAYK